MNIKKLLISFGLVLTIIIMMSGMARANDTAEDSNLPLSNKKLFSKLLTGIGIENPDYSFKLSEIFGGAEKNYGQNLYLAIYEKTVVEPEQTAMQKVGQAKGLNTVEVGEVLGGSIEPLIQKYPRITQEQAIAWARQMRELYSDYIDTESLRNETEMGVMPIEIFANNDTSDSGFDLIADLNDIEMILFKNTTPVDINLIYSGGHPSEATPLPQKFEPSSSPVSPYPQTLVGTNKGGIVVGGIAGTTAEKTGEEAKTGTIESYSAEQLACPSDTNLDNAINDYNGNHPGTLPTPSNQTGNEGNQGGPGSNGSTAVSGDIFAINPNVEIAENKKLEPASSGNWKDNPLCTDNKRFCVEIATHSSTYNLYYPTDPCIACHIQKINEALATVVSHNLVPKKLTGNLMEMSKCKSGYNFSQFVSINLILVPMPIITPQKMETIFGKNIVNEFKKFVNSYTPFNIENNRDKAVEIVEPQTSSETTQTEMLREIDRAIYESKIAAEKQLNNMLTSTKSSDQSEFFQSLMRELDQMKIFFESYKTLLEGINATCAVIKNKDYVE